MISYAGGAVFGKYQLYLGILWIGPAMLFFRPCRPCICCKSFYGLGAPGEGEAAFQLATSLP